MFVILNKPLETLETILIQTLSYNNNYDSLHYNIKKYGSKREKGWSTWECQKHDVVMVKRILIV